MQKQNRSKSKIWDRLFRSSIRSGLLFGTLGFASWLVGITFLWPSIGPTAYLLAFDRDKNHPFIKVFGAHAIGALSGLAAHLIFAPDLKLSTITYPLESSAFQITVSAIVALALTTGLMRATGWDHSPACATTLIVALGLISHPVGVAFILAAVVFIYLIHFLTELLFEKIGWIE